MVRLGAEIDGGLVGAFAAGERERVARIRVDVLARIAAARTRAGTVDLAGARVDRGALAGVGGHIARFVGIRRERRIAGASALRGFAIQAIILAGKPVGWSNALPPRWRSGSIGWSGIAELLGEG